MAKRKLKCQYCGVSDTLKEDMEFEEVGAKKTKKYYHKDCHKEYLKDKYLKENVMKCEKCGVKDTLKDNMEFEERGERKNKVYFHKPCYQEHLIEKEFKEKERQELDKLIEVIKDIYGVKDVPNGCYPYLQDVRNGTKFFGKYDYKYKQGYPYDLIAETFDYCSETIQYWNSRKSFNGFSNALRYGLAVVCDKLLIVENRRKDRERQQILIEKHVEQEVVTNQEFETSYKKKNKSNTDISDFLD